MQLIPENTSRKMDNLGRVTLPKGLRERLGWVGSNDMLEVFTANIDGRLCVCLTPPIDETANKLVMVSEVFEQYGLELPQVLKNKIAMLQAGVMV